MFLWSSRRGWGLFVFLRPSPIIGNGLRAGLEAGLLGGSNVPQRFLFFLLPSPLHPRCWRTEEKSAARNSGKKNELDGVGQWRVRFLSQCSRRSEAFLSAGFPSPFMGFVASGGGVIEATCGTQVKSPSPWSSISSSAGRLTRRRQTISWAGCAAETSNQQTSVIALIPAIMCAEEWGTVIPGEKAEDLKNHAQYLGAFQVCPDWKMNPMLPGDLFVTPIQHPSCATAKSHAVALHYFN